VTDREPPVVGSLPWLLDLERIDRDLFRGPSPEYTGRSNLFGGQVAAQALRAAALTVEAPHLPHSFHLYFMRAGQIGRPVVLYVNRIRDGRSFTTRNVVAQQDGEAILTMSASFHKAEGGELDVQLPAASVPPPEAIPTREPSRVPFGHAPFETAPIEERSGPGPEGRLRRWVRSLDVLPDDPVVHACALAYMSDMATGSPPVLAARRRFEDFMMTSLDHALHFHRTVRADRWLLVDFESVSVGRGRGMTRGTIHAQDGTLGATVQQELLLRELAPGRPSRQPASHDLL